MSPAFTNMAARGSASQAAPVGSTLLVVHNFVARSGDELSLAKGDRIELIERDDDFGDGWFLGKHLGNGRTGLFPEVYTTLAPKPTLSNAIQQRAASESLVNNSSLSSAAATAAATAATSSSPTQIRHSSASAASMRPASASDTAPPTAQPTLRASLPATSAVLRNDAISTASPVMNETLSVINEHMNDMHTPSTYASTSNKRNSTGRGYVFIAGEETDEEERQMHTEAEVMAWSPDRVAEYLEDQGVEKAHCDVFKEQEITGEVLLAMEQSSLFLKEFALGSVGRRLKTWHKIRALQDEVRVGKPPDAPSNTSEYEGEGTEAGDTARDRTSTVGSALPRALDTSRQTTAAPGRSNTSHLITDSGMSPTAGPEATWTPPAQMTPAAQLQRRGSDGQTTLDAAQKLGNRELHRKQPSLDQNWQPGQPQNDGQYFGHAHSLSSDAAYPALLAMESSVPSTPSNHDIEKASLSSVGQARTNTTSGTRKTSADVAGSEMSRSSVQSGAVGSPELLRDSMSPATKAQGTFGALTSVGSTVGGARAATSPALGRQPTDVSPLVTKLDHNDASSEGLSPSTAVAGTDASLPRSATSPKIPFFSNYKPNFTGLRTISDTISRNEKQAASPFRDASSPARTGSSTPSTETKSLEYQKPEGQSRTSDPAANLVPPTPNQRRIRVKPKKATSAYTRGLENKKPAEQMIGSDYSGWMKKKSGSLMTTWKTRLFVLRGRRLSYYYSENDTEEKGLIDISFHRVLPAHNETLTGLHAAITGVSGSSPSSPKEGTTPTAAEQDLAEHPATGEANDGVFIFKLVPPKSGLSKAVNFTKPTVHYFAVNSRQEGRLWMAALMKATIDRDEDSVVTTTYNQKTISLAKARARRERPPALMESDGEKEATSELDGAGDDAGSGRQGLGIGGLGEKEDAVAGAGAESTLPDEDASLAPSTTTATTEVGSFTQQVNESLAGLAR